MGVPLNAAEARLPREPQSGRDLLGVRDSDCRLKVSQDARVCVKRGDPSNWWLNSGFPLKPHQKGHRKRRRDRAQGAFPAASGKSGTKFVLSSLLKDRAIDFGLEGYEDFARLLPGLEQAGMLP